ncbi:uncharacterized protein LTR77_010902 [Saxophila tyrrhenica]|uniref:DUF7587 domain-containing protein n=1 Tax=Saxophila tyrrhenica TaxID=1690608 RepID=A0AAV9NXQ3_9PEZI|nr:hypothetical protein LTR77_010902 [Saxophila tyrrhenica]
MAKANPGEPRPAQIKWTEDMRLTLDVLMLDFNFDRDTAVALFSGMFKDHLRKCNDPEVNWRKLHVQHKEKKREADAGRMRNWGFCMLTDEHAFARRNAVKAKISKAKRELSTVDTPPTTSRTTPAARPKPVTSAANASKKITLPTPPSSASTPRTSLPRNVRSTWKKRSASIASLTESEDELVVTPPRSNKARKVVTAVSPNQPADPPATPGSRTQALKTWRESRTDATEYVEIRPGKGAWLSMARAIDARGPPVCPHDDKAHPNVTGLMYRVYDEQSQSPLSPHGFVAGRHALTLRLPASPPPTKQSPAWIDMALHLNRDKVHTPFVSCSINLMWTLRLALEEGQRGREKKISIIDSSRLERKKVFWARPFHAALCKVVQFTKGAFYYHGKWEFMIYDRIPRNAVIKTVSVQDIYDLASRLPDVGATLRLNQIAKLNKGYLSQVLPALKAQNMKLTAPVIKSIARIAEFLGVGHTFPLFVSGIVSDVISEWGIAVCRQTEQEWLAKADIFATTICSGETVRLKDFYLMKAAFRDGVRWGNASDYNPRFEVAKTNRAVKKAGTVGLGGSMKPLTDELDAAKLGLMVFEREVQKSLPQGAGGSGSGVRRALLENVGDDEMDEADDVAENDDSGFDESMFADDRAADDDDGDDDDGEDALRQFRGELMNDSDDKSSVYEL